VDFIELVLQRRSIRKYKPDPVPDEKLKYVLEAARIAPSWGNRQCWQYLIVTDEALRKKIIARASPPSPSAEGRPVRPRDWIAQAPIIIVGCADPTKSGNKEGKEYYLLDMGISMEHLILAAAEQGLGTCWIGGGFDETVVKEALRIPPEIRVVALTPLGYPDEVTEPRPRKTMEEMTRSNYWKESPFPFSLVARASYSMTR
jgi:nitroreductase